MIVSACVLCLLVSRQVWVAGWHAAMRAAEQTVVNGFPAWVLPRLPLQEMREKQKQGSVCLT